MKSILRLAAALGLVCAPLPAAARPPVVSLDSGDLQGSLNNGVVRFLGVPYAAAPVGPLRWKPPVPVARHGLIQAIKYANVCPQNNTLGVFSGPPGVDEDCLYLNVFTTVASPSHKALKPVIVWFHGGGNFTGSSSDYDGSALAAAGPYGTPTVVVTVNYRLGLLGFLAHPALMNEGALAANYGIMDQQAALQWVKANISAFGGDPERVAIAGQSGGSVNVHANVISPLSAGLFDKAIFQSAPAAMFSPLEASRSRALAFAAAAGCPSETPATSACLRRLAPSRILQLQGSVIENGPYLDPANQNVILDGMIIPLQPAAAYASGKFNRVPVMGGTTQDEMTFVLGRDLYFGKVGAQAKGYSESDFMDRVRALYGPKADKVLIEYAVSKFGGSAFEALNRVLADPITCWANLRSLKLLATQTATFGYIFTYQDSPYFFPSMPGFRARAAHTIDIQFLFRGYHGGPLGLNLDQTTGKPRNLNRSETMLSDEMIGYWTNFAGSGDPNGKGLPQWLPINSNDPRLLKQDIPISTVSETDVIEAYNCDFWEKL